MKLAKFLFHVGAILTLFGPAALYAREMQALVVGVSEYPNLSKEFQLDGPRNDVVRLRQLLMQRGFAPQRIKVLADGVNGAGMPTKGNILTELGRIAKTARRGDVVLLYFAGHGSQQPADPGTPAGKAESDGMFEIFLPRDVGKWSGSLGSVENALVKTELRDAVDKILATGAFVWGIFDSCHSATLVRGIDNDVRYRYVDPVALGVPRQAPTSIRDLQGTRAAGTNRDAADTLLSEAKGKAGMGGSVFFYASQTREATPEMRLPQGHPHAKQFGLFGFMVMEALASGVPMTYRQMAQYVLMRYGAINESRVTPLFSGTGLDQAVLLQDAAPVRQWQIEPGQELIVHGGALAGLTPGSVVGVIANPLAKSESALGYLKLTDVGLASSVAIPIEFAGKPAPRRESIVRGSFARVVQVAPEYSLRVSVDPRDCGQNCLARKVIDQLRTVQSGIPGTAITWVEAPSTGDVMLKLLPERILLLPPSMQGLDCSAAAAVCRQSAAVWPDTDAEPGKSLQAKLALSLHAIARTTNLMRIAARQSTVGRGNSKLEVTLKLITPEGMETPLRADHVPRLRAGNRIRVDLTNNGIKPIDVTMLYVDARYGISVLFPSGEGGSNRLEPGAGTDLEVAITDETLGMERMLMIAVEAGKTRERADFSFLEQSPLTASRLIQARPADEDVLAFMDAGFADFTTRSGGEAPQAPSSRTAMQVFTFEITK